MVISVTEFKARCLDLIRKAEVSGESVTIHRRGRIVARLEPAGIANRGKPWERLRALGGSVTAKPNESILQEEDFEELRSGDLGIAESRDRDR